MDEARRYKKQVREDLDRSIGLLNKAVKFKTYNL
ncbi:hypothetical protein IEC97_19960 [Neobacillus cucumis]|nr:hypothetical protein [Neobacillus cucumis]